MYTRIKASNFDVPSLYFLSGLSIIKVLFAMMLRHYIFLLIHWSPGWLYSPPGWAEWPLTPHMHSPQFYRDPAPHNTLGYSRGQRKQILAIPMGFCVAPVAPKPLPETLILTPNSKVKKCGGTLFIIFISSQPKNWTSWLEGTILCGCPCITKRTILEPGNILTRANFYTSHCLYRPIKMNIFPNSL